MAKYIVEGWNEAVVDGNLEMNDSVSVFFTSKVRANKFAKDSGLMKVFVGEVKYQRGCLSEGDECDSFWDTAYCSWCM